ncbi:MAG: hypothetical protein CVT48_06655 [Thermoplasmata archaeon HGW-Thermoplasmata-1]|nr:MAG: hypothetical protein CVT48_06655 [Thermoplasmata archaeon HGW-Thermoplasmata-1]
MPAHMKMSSLLLMLWGGSVMLVVDHAWNKEIVAYPPFLLSENLALDLLLGVAMTLAIFIVWGIMVYAGIARNKKIRASA